ncbi:MAG: transcriptional activator domain, partial [uncultured Thermomicrobiales bacterium]
MEETVQSQRGHNPYGVDDTAIPARDGCDHGRGTDAGEARVTAPGRTGAGLVGRRRELALLHEQFAAAARGQAVVTLVAGDPGIGKTRLLQSLAARAAETGARVLRGGASEAEGMPPYLPFLEALGTHIRTAPPEEVREQAGALAPVLASILPELATKLSDLPTSYSLPPEQARLRLYEAVGVFLAAIAAPRPLVLLLDDLQWADAASLDLLCHVARTQPDARLLILGAYRAGEVAHNRALERALAALNRLRTLTVVTAGPLSATEIAALAAGVLGDP